MSGGSYTTQEVEAPMHFQFTDGGREAAGFRGDAGDCVTRAIAVALDLPYREVYDELAARIAETGKPRSARNGIPRKVYEHYLGYRGWRWFPTMHIGSGCRVHLRADEVPKGRIIVRLSKHVCAVIDGVVHDTFDPSREGTRCVYGYFKYDEAADHEWVRRHMAVAHDLAVRSANSALGPSRATRRAGRMGYE